MTDKKNKITVTEVAKKANVSIATVSRVLNSSVNVSSEISDRVHRAVKETGYSPLALQSGSVRKSLKTVGILVPDLHNLFYSYEIMGIEDELERSGYSVVLCHTHEDIDKEEKYLNDLQKKAADGIVMIGSRKRSVSSDHIVEIAATIPVVMINEHIFGSNVYSVVVDVVDGAYKAVTHLLESGHTKIGLINGPDEYSTFSQKEEGYRLAMNKFGADILSEHLVVTSQYEEGGYEAACKLLSLPDCPTAIFVSSDQMAIGVLSAIHEAGLNVPGDVAVVGFSNMPLASRLSPPLTTIDQFPFRCGQLAAEHLLKAMNHSRLEQRKIIVEPELVVRESTVNKKE